MSTLVPLGHVEVPDGVLVIVDPGLGRFWRGRGDPRSPRASDPAQTDLEIVGADAVAAGVAYDRSFDPRYLFDVTDGPRAIARFAAFAREHDFDAKARPRSSRMSHHDRARSAAAFGDGLGVVVYNGLWGVVADGLPTERPLAVRGELMPAGEFERRFAWIDVIVAEGEHVPARGPNASVEGVMVDHGQLMFAGLEGMHALQVWKSLDGLADFVFHGPDAAAVADKFGATTLSDTHYGWRDVAMGEIGTHAQAVQEWVAGQKLRVGIDYRPHCNLERFNAQLRASAEDTAELQLAGARTVACGNRWGDGMFAVERRVAADGSLARLRVVLATEARMNNMRVLQLAPRGAVVSNKILDDAEPVRFADRAEPRDGRDSGWSFFAGTEDDAYAADASNFQIASIRHVLRIAPELRPIIVAPPGSEFRREGDQFVPG
ncbi:MAG: DUF2185 domain-containing protein [Myxococcota bacterium]